MTEVVIAYDPFFVWMLHAVVEVGGVGDVEMQAFVTLLPAASRTVPVIVLGCFVAVVGSGVGDADAGSWTTGELDATGDADAGGALTAGAVGDAIGAGGGGVSPICGRSPSSSTIAAD